MLGAGDGTITNAEHHHRTELDIMVHSTSPSDNSDTREEDEEGEEGGNSTTSSGGVETGPMANHKLTFPQHQHQRQIQSNNIIINNNNNSNKSRATRVDTEHQQPGGKEGVPGSRAEQQMLIKGELDHTCKPGERTGPGYEHGNDVSSQPHSGTRAMSEFNNCYGTSRVGPGFDQHGGPQSTGMGMGMMHSSGPNNTDPGHSTHDGYHNNQYNHYPGYRPGYGMVAPSRQGNNMMMGSGGSTTAGNAKAAMRAGASGPGGGVGGFQRFPGHAQHPSGATPTLNQLLTSPSPMMRGYGSGYQDYNMPPAQQPGIGLQGKDMASQYGSTSHGWSGHQRNPQSMSPGNGGQGISRAQVNAKPTHSVNLRPCEPQRLI
ncbi:hypothetical protein DPEC_G00313890 [Dallia pectoralis]|uniref:Uncharacterized protein n=1 Tax=Dallia pectoralis TaxID=75939 RepID=A0ACC2FC28_DALPE|nr:hypothetical protein DPEC_G00313890 [Dallia pectoralis]